VCLSCDLELNLIARVTSAAQAESQLATTGRDVEEMDSLLVLD